MPERVAALDAHATVLGFDYGEKRLGIAVGQTITWAANPLATIAVRGGHPDWHAIAGLVREYAPQLLVVGTPVRADGSVHPLAARIERFCNQLRQRYHLPVHLIDERLSSLEAADRQQEAGHGLDAVAAQVILETWLHANRGR